MHLFNAISLASAFFLSSAEAHWFTYLLLFCFFWHRCFKVSSCEFIRRNLRHRHRYFFQTVKISKLVWLDYRLHITRQLDHVGPWKWSTPFFSHERMNSVMKWHFCLNSTRIRGFNMMIVWCLDGQVNIQVIIYLMGYWWCTKTLITYLTAQHVSTCSLIRLVLDWPVHASLIEDLLCFYFWMIY